MTQLLVIDCTRENSLFQEPIPHDGLQKSILVSMETMFIWQPMMSLAQIDSGYIQDCWPHGWGSMACLCTQAWRFQHGFSLIDDWISWKWKYKCQLLGCEVRWNLFKYFLQYIHGFFSVPLWSSHATPLWHFSGLISSPLPGSWFDFPLVSRKVPYLPYWHKRDRNSFPQICKN